MINKDLLVDWIGTVVNYFIILFIFIKAWHSGSLDFIDISLTFFGLIISVFILTVKALGAK